MPLPKLSSLFKDGITAAVASITDGASNIIKDFKADPNKVLEIDLEMKKLTEQAFEKANDFQVQIAQIETDREKAELADSDSARKMQIAALAQNDQFAKRYIYYLATIVIAFVFIYDICMFFVKYPSENRDIINMVAGVLNATALVMVLSFFFGSSKSSHDKDNTISKLSQ